MKNTLTEENYLKAVFHLANEKNEILLNELSKFLDVKMPTANNMMKKFADKGWVKIESYRPIRITAAGRKEAALVVRKHRLTEMFLVEKMNFGWEDVHEIAEQLEHVHSGIFFDKMDELLDFPRFDPHGEPIPDKEGVILPNNFRKLSSCKAGDQVVFKAVTFSEEDFLNYLNNRELSLETKIKIISVEQFDGSMVINSNGKTHSVGISAADRILVQ